MPGSAEDVWQVRRKLHANPTSLVVARHSLDQIERQAEQAHGLKSRHHPTGLDPERVHEAAEHLVHPASAADNGVGLSDDFFGPVGVTLEHLSVAEHRRERVSQVVGDGPQDVLAGPLHLPKLRRVALRRLGLRLDPSVRGHEPGVCFLDPPRLLLGDARVLERPGAGD